jgi:Na+/H+ antiporter NhaD/arsenite permease-like protein
MEPLITAVLIFSLTFLLIFIEIIHKTLAVLLGVFLMLFLGIVSLTDIGNFLNFDVLALVFGIMVIIQVIKDSGIFQFLGIKAVKFAKGNKKILFILFMLLTVFISTFLNSITAMLIMGALTFALCRKMKFNPIPFIIGESIFVDIGDNVLLISSIQNMLIASVAKLTFFDFLIFALPFSMILLFVSIPVFLFIYRKDLKEEDNFNLEIDEWSVVPDKKFFWKSSIIFISFIIFFALADYLGISRSLVAVSFAIIILLLSGADIDDTLKSIDWGMLFFFGGLFIIVGGVEKVGFLDLIAKKLLSLVANNKALSLPLVTLFSTLASGIIENVSVTITLIPIVKTIVSSLGLNLLWWCLIFGANLGGNATPISSPSNIVAMSISKNEGFTLPLGEYTKIGIIITVLHLTLAFGYLLLLFFLGV